MDILANIGYGVGIITAIVGFIILIIFCPTFIGFTILVLGKNKNFQNYSNRTMILLWWACGCLALSIGGYALYWIGFFAHMWGIVQ